MSARRNNIFIFALALLGVIAIGFFVWPTTPKSAALDAREQLMELLGTRIATLRPKCKVLLLANPFAQKAGHFHESSQFDRAGLRGLQKGLGNDSSITVVIPEIRPEYIENPSSVIIPPDSKTPLSFLIQPASIDRFAEAHPECNVIVSLIGLPLGIDQLKVWNEKDPRSFALLLPDLRVLGPRSAVVAAFQQGKLLAAGIQDQMSGEPVIVTRDNIVQILEQQPQTLGF